MEGTLTVSAAIDDYLDTLRMMRRPRTLESATQILGEFRLVFADRPLTDITRKDLLTYLDKLKRNNGARTLANKFVRINAMLRHHDIKVTKRGDRPVFTRTTPRIYDGAEIDRFLATCDGRQKIFFKMLLMTGLRMSEAKYLEWGDLHNGMLHVQAHPPRFNPKTHEERRIPVPTALWTMLHSMERRPGKLVFPTATGTPDWHLLRHCKRIAERAGLNASAWGLHKFRKTYCTNLLRSGMDVRTVMSLMGHSSIQTTLRYLRPIEAENLRSKMDNVFAAYTA